MPKQITLNSVQLQMIHNAVLATYPNEMCGFLTEDSFITCNNVHEEPTKSFRISPQDIIKYLDKSIAIVHSHCKDQSTYYVSDIATPSLADRINQQSTGKPWLIFGTDGIMVTEPVQYPRVPNREYLYRPFIWAINDCYTLVQDFYRFEFDIDLKDVPIDIDYNDINLLTNTFEAHITDYGFREVKLSTVSNGDLIVMDNGGFLNNHLGIYWEGKILHQNAISLVEPFEKYIEHITKALKYVD